MNGKKALTRLYSDVSNQVSQGLKAIQEFSDEHLKDLKDAKSALAYTSKKIFRHRVHQEKRSRFDYLATTIDQCRSSYIRERLVTLADPQEYAKMKEKCEAKRNRQYEVTFLPKRSTAKARLLPEKAKDVKCIANAPSYTSSCPRSSSGIDNKQCGRDRSSQKVDNVDSRMAVSEDRHQNIQEAGSKDFKTQLVRQFSYRPDYKEKLPTEKLLKYWMKFDDNKVMQDYLKDIQRRSPKAYVLELLKHRLTDDVSDETSAAIRQSTDIRGDN